MANNTNYKPNEGKREEFRRYLEKTGVMDALTKVLVLLYEEADKPDDALRFILNALSKQVGGESIDELKAQVASLQEKLGQMGSQAALGTPQASASATGQRDSTTLEAPQASSAEQQGAGAAGTPHTSEDPALDGGEEPQEKPAASAVTLEEGDA